MSRKLTPVACAAIAAAAIPFLSATQADAGYRYNACVTAKYDTRLRLQSCDYDCRRWVGHGRAFRVLREDGRYLLVRNRSMRGWIKFRALRLAQQDYCYAAGI